MITNMLPLSTILFADDTTLSYSDPNYDVFIGVANAEMEIVLSGCVVNF